MTNKVTEGIQSSSLAFLNLQRRQNVSKSKLEEEFVQKAWNTCSAGFGGNNLANKEQPKKKFNFKSENIGGNLCSVERNLETLHCRLSGADYKAVKRKSMLEIGNIDTDFFPPPIKNSCDTQLLNSAQFLLSLKKAEMGHKEKRKSDSLCVTKKQSNPLQSIENPFKKDIANIVVKLPVKLYSELHTILISDILPEQSVEQENIHKKRKVPDGIFINPSLNFPSPCSVKEVLKKSVVPPILHDSDSFTEAAHKKRVHDSATSTRIYRSEEINKHSSSLIFHSNAKSSLNNLNASKVYLNNSSTNKGSNWVQSLQLTLSEQDESDHQDRLKIKKLRNMLQGGYAEQLLKLQRREQSEKIIWEHKMNKNKEKAVKNAFYMVVIAIAHADNIVIAKCTCLDFSYTQIRENIKMHNPDIAENVLLSIAPPHDVLMDTENISKLPESQLFLVLFKKSHFYQLHLKVKDVFRLHPPWQILKSSSSCTIILCTYFVEYISQSPENNLAEEGIPYNAGHSNSPSTLSTGLSSTNVFKEIQSSTSVEELFFRWGEFLSLNGRVQRIWYHQVHLPESFPKYTKHYRFSLLLQEQGGTFYEVILTTQSSLTGSWHHFVSSAEGKCFGFHNLRLTHRLPLKKHKPLVKFLESFVHQQNAGEQRLDQEFYYQLMFDINCEIPEEVSNESYPPYCQAQVEPMSKLLEGSPVQRFSFIGNILFEHKNVFYMSDESLLHKPLIKYFQLQLSYPFETKSLVMGSAVFIREALFSEGYLVLDKYSNFTVLSESCSIPQNLAVLNKLKQLTLVKLQSLVMPLSIYCKVSDIVSIEGVIVNVDESSAFTFLQCCFCLQENLVQARNLVIYCEDCSQIVPKPILKIKMEVSICCQGLDSVLIHVQLLSATIKKILEISDDVQQPHCSVADVLGRNVGPIICYIKSCGSTGTKQMFHLSEIRSI